MFIDIDTINALLLPPVLFGAFFSFASYLLNNPSQLPETAPGANFTAYKEAVSSSFDPDPEEETELIPDCSDTDRSIQTKIQPALYEQTLELIARLTKRDCRRLCSPVNKGGLGIQMKSHGVEKTRPMMGAAIRKAFKADPERVIAVIRERLPGKLPPETLEKTSQIPLIA
ncbi:MAG: hypothetical protein AB4426_19550 [Xenococcaceae cyanobacterium]